MTTIVDRVGERAASAALILQNGIATLPSADGHPSALDSTWITALSLAHAPVARQTPGAVGHSALVRQDGTPPLPPEPPAAPPAPPRPAAPPPVPDEEHPPIDASIASPKTAPQRRGDDDVRPLLRT